MRIHIGNGKTGRMSVIKIETLVLGNLATNCYLVINEGTKELVIIDPAAMADRVMDAIDRLQAAPVAVLLTHGHFDHIGAADDLRAEYHIPICAMVQEKETLASEMINLSAFHGDAIRLSADEWLRDGQTLEFLGENWQVLFTPGHTQGGCCYYLPERGVLFSGDTLFQGSIGRTDFYGGDIHALVTALRTKLLTLPEDTIVYPGHGNATVIGWERRNNPYNYSAGRSTC